MSSVKDIFKKCLFYLSAPKCVCCGERLKLGELALCEGCVAKYKENLTDKCSVCFNELSGCLCVNDFLDTHFIHKLVKVVRYEYSTDSDKRAANELIYHLKRNPRRDIVEFITNELLRATSSSGLNFEDYIITSVPRSRARIVKYGHDHSQMIAKSLAKALNIKYMRLLKSKSSSVQKKLHREQRIDNAKFDYRFGAKSIEGKKLLLLDDIVTTGASMGSSALLLRGLGAKKIVGITFAITFRDRHKRFLTLEQKRR